MGKEEEEGEEKMVYKMEEEKEKRGIALNAR